MPRIISKDQAIITEYNNDEIKGMKKKIMIGSKDGKPTMALRVMEVEVNGYSPLHKHPWEHINYILSGKGILKTENGDFDLLPGQSVFVESNTLHQYRNNSDEIFSFICLVPTENE